MTFADVKQLLYDIVAKYHSKAMVVWEKTKGVTPKPPYITLGYSDLNRSVFSLSDEEENQSCYNYEFLFEVNLYTAGKKVKAGNKVYYENTAMEDLEEFIRFLDSEEITDQLAQKNVTIICNLPIRDLSELIGDTKFNYRSMCEFTVSFVQAAAGRYGIAGQGVPNPSGGGLTEFTEAETPVIETVEIKEGGNNDEE